MKTLKKVCIVFTVLLLFPVMLFTLIFGFAWLDGYGVFENYSGWRRVEIPTESEFKATVKLPKEWDFVVEDGRIKIKDTDGNVIATECYEGWRVDYYQGGVHHDNKDEMDINSELPDYYRDLDNYEFVRGAESSCYVYKITEGSVSSYALSMYIMGSHIKDGSYTLFLVFDSKFSDLDFYEKIQKSYRFAGIIEEESLFQ